MVERGEQKSNAVKGAISLNRQKAEQYTQINKKNIFMWQNRGFIDENKDGTVVKSYFAKRNIFTGKVA